VIVRQVHVGAPETHEFQGKPVETAFFKYPAGGPVMLRTLGFDGDHQVDRVHHGGPEKAALLYPAEHYAHWERELGRSPGPAAMGENLTVEGLTETTVCIGDVYQIGQATVEVCQPRVPCYKTAIRHGVPDMAARVAAAGYTGFYVRVLAEGLVAAGDTISLVNRPDGAPSVAACTHLLFHDRKNKPAIEAVLESKALAEVWRVQLRKLLEQ